MLHVSFRKKGVLREFKKESRSSTTDSRVIVDFPNHPGYETYYSELEKVPPLQFEVSVKHLLHFSCLSTD